jgi:NAD-dependent deacetylase sirtuin 4
MEKIECIVTQNVDNLHSKAGSKKMIELHGTAFKVTCLNCNYKICRYKLQEIFQILNPFVTATTQMIRPDGDVELTQVCIIYITNLSIYIYGYIWKIF